VATDPADLEPKLVLIDDEFSSMTDDEYAAALAAWIAEAETIEPIDLPVTAAETLREIREHGET
jgi:hypothetical protein